MQVGTWWGFQNGRYFKKLQDNDLRLVRGEYFLNQVLNDLPKVTQKSVAMQFNLPFLSSQLTPLSVYPLFSPSLTTVIDT